MKTKDRADSIWEKILEVGPRNGLIYLEAINDQLKDDTNRCIGKCLELQVAFESGINQDDEEALFKDIFFWERNCLRAFVAEVEGTLFVMRRIVALADERGEISLSAGEATLIKEREYRLDARRKKIEERDKPNRLLENFVLAFSLLPRVYGAAFIIDYGNHGWESLQRVIEARNSVTHPKSLDDLFLGDRARALQPAIAWFHTCLRGLLDCAKEARYVDLGFVRHMVAPDLQPRNQIRGESLTPPNPVGQADG